MATRSQAREVVIQLLYAYGSGNDGISKFVDPILEEQKIKNAQNAFAKALFFGVLEHICDIDLRIRHELKGWDFSRIGDIERAILRLGAYEIVFAKMDKAVVINEALELAKSFGNEPSVKFINGVLDGVAKSANTDIEAINNALKEVKLEPKVESKTKNATKNTAKKGIKSSAKPKNFKKTFKKDSAKKDSTKAKKSVIVKKQKEA